MPELARRPPGLSARADEVNTCRNLVPTFPQRSPPSLLTTAACGGLRSTPDCRPRRALLHLSYSYAPPCGPALLVTQCQQRSFGFSEPHERESGATRCDPGFRAAGPKAPNPARRFPHPQPDRPFLVRSPTPQLSRPPREKG